jgi:hypothetical protein
MYSSKVNKKAKCYERSDRYSSRLLSNIGEQRKLIKRWHPLG